jgi:hypothetical protein
MEEEVVVVKGQEEDLKKNMRKMTEETHMCPGLRGVSGRRGTRWRRGARGRRRGRRRSLGGYAC